MNQLRNEANSHGSYTRDFSNSNMLLGRTLASSNLFLDTEDPERKKEIYVKEAILLLCF